jgi:calcineurin-like phosphoesterase
MTDKINILFIGDIVGRPGRKVVLKYLEELKSGLNGIKPDFIIANAENASHGFGLTHKNYNDFVDAGIGCLTSGNHIWDKKEVFKYIDTEDKLIVRQISEGVPGKGSGLFELESGVKIGVINLQGRIFINTLVSHGKVLKKNLNI